MQIKIIVVISSIIYYLVIVIIYNDVRHYWVVLVEHCLFHIVVGTQECGAVAAHCLIFADTPLISRALLPGVGGLVWTGSVLVLAAGFTDHLLALVWTFVASQLFSSSPSCARVFPNLPRCSGTLLQRS